jgi:hypothetical protein
MTHALGTRSLRHTVACSLPSTGPPLLQRPAAVADAGPDGRVAPEHQPSTATTDHLGRLPRQRRAASARSVHGPPREGTA